MKFLILYTTKHGSVEKAAALLESKLEGQVTKVNLMKEQAPQLDEYDRIILAGSIYAGRIQKQLSEYIASNKDTLLQKKIGLFICAGAPNPEDRIKELESVYPQEIYNHAICKEHFGYELNYNKLGFFERTIMRMVSGSKESKSEYYEDKIEAFAKNISAV